MKPNRRKVCEKRLLERLEKLADEAIAQRSELLQARLAQLDRQIKRLVRALRGPALSRVVERLANAENERAAITAELADFLLLSRDPATKAAILHQVFPDYKHRQ